MGSGASLQLVDSELQRPIDCSDVSISSSVNEVIRLRTLAAHAQTHLLAGWQRVFDADSCMIYYYHDSGMVQWEIPAADSTYSNPNPSNPPPSDPTTADFVASHNVFQSKLAIASKAVINQLRRQQVNWESEWHEQLLDYVVELRTEVDDLRKVSEKKYDKLTKSAEARASDLAQEAESNAETVKAEQSQKKADRHSKLMAKLARKKQMHQKKLVEKQKSSKELISSLRTNFKTQLQHHALTLHIANTLTGAKSSDATKGWVQLWDETVQNCYYWHPEKGSTWDRPAEMEFNLNLKSTLNSEITDDNAIGVDGKAAIEKFFVDNQIERMELNDVQLEEEIAQLEDELEKRKTLKYGADVHAMAKHDE